MLSRVASSLYWLSRYVERSDGILRMLAKLTTLHHRIRPRILHGNRLSGYLPDTMKKPRN